MKKPQVLQEEPRINTICLIIIPNIKTNPKAFGLTTLIKKQQQFTVNIIFDNIAISYFMF